MQISIELGLLYRLMNSHSRFGALNFWRNVYIVYTLVKKKKCSVLVHTGCTLFYDKVMCMWCSAKHWNQYGGENVMIRNLFFFWKLILSIVWRIRSDIEVCIFYKSLYIKTVLINSSFMLEKCRGLSNIRYSVKTAFLAAIFKHHTI